MRLLSWLSGLTFALLAAAHAPAGSRIVRNVNSISHLRARGLQISIPSESEHSRWEREQEALERARVQASLRPESGKPRRRRKGSLPSISPPRRTPPAYVGSGSNSIHEGGERYRQFRSKSQTSSLASSSGSSPLGHGYRSPPRSLPQTPRMSPAMRVQSRPSSWSTPDWLQSDGKKKKGWKAGLGKLTGCLTGKCS